MREQARENLKAALAAIRELQANAGVPVQGESEQQSNLLQRAKEVRTTCAVQLLQASADEEAAELLKLNARRRELLASLTGFLQTEFVIDGESRRPEMSRMISAALVTESLSLADPSASESTDRWKLEFESLINQ